jgi:hypothetical protein
MLPSGIPRDSGSLSVGPLSVVASANPANRTSSMSRIFGTDISNIATNGVPLPTGQGLGGLQ